MPWAWLWAWACVATCVADWRFPHARYNLSVAENNPPRSLAAPVADHPAPYISLPRTSTRVKFRVRAGDPEKLFRADERALGGLCFLQLKTRVGHVLNRERRASYNLTIRATAALSDGRTLEADTEVHVMVEDVDDLDPLFYPTEYEVELPEDSPPMTSVVRVSAEDADLGLGGEVYYSIADVESGFVVHPTTGIVYLTKPLRRTEKAAYEVIVHARDRAAALTHSAGIRPPARAILTVLVRSVNMYSPEISIRHLPEVAEDAADEIFAIVKVTDKDDGEDGRIARLDVVQGDPDGHFRLRPSEVAGEWLLVVHSLLRGGGPQSYNLTLRARDSGRPPREGYGSVAARRGRPRAARPVFGRAIYSASVHESAPPGTPLVRLKLARREGDDVYIEIVGGNEGGEFTVNPDSGMLYTAVRLDAERRAHYTLTVSAVDQGEAGVRDQSSAKVEVSVIDDNDNDPVFDDDDIEVDLDENGPARTLVARMQAKDADSGENAYVSYSIANLQPVPFEIDHFTGAVYTSRRLDYESMRRNYELRIRAGDWGQPYRRLSEAKLSVRLRDVNDNRPQWERISCTGRLSRTAPPGRHLATLSAIDYDAGDVVSYRVLAGNDDGCFALDATTGALTLLCDLRQTRADVRVLNVTATDGAHFADTASYTFLLSAAIDDGVILPLECRDTGVTRRLADLLAAAARTNAARHDEDPPSPPGRYGQNAHSPEFRDFPLELRVNESVSLGSTLVRLRAEDRDLGYNGLLAFAISGGDTHSAFRVDPDTGELQVVGYLDREREDEYFLNVTVYDRGTPSKSTSRLLPITVLDANDNAPEFEKSVASFVVAENARNGTAVFTARATDRDAGRFGDIVYSLEGDKDCGLCVDRGGTLYVCGPLDRERQDTLELRVVAEDGGGRRGTAAVRVVLDDVNDNAPHFDRDSLTARVRDDVPTGAPVAWLRATDADEGAAGRVRYRLADDEEAALRVEPWSGAVLATGLSPDRAAYAVRVIAEDCGTPSLSTTATLLLELQRVDRNLHSPEFPSQLESGKVRENQPSGTRVLSVSATDRDAPGRDSRLHYYIQDGSGIGFFSVNDSGTIHTLAPLDRETTPHFWVTLCAEDHGLVPRHSCIQVYIEVEDVNDMYPWTVQSEYSVEISEDAPLETSVVRLEASDGDVESNITYRIAAGNPGGWFHVHPQKGLLTTTGRMLDRERQAQHSLDLRLTDGRLASTTRVLVTLTDVNDHAPAFLEHFYSVGLPHANAIDRTDSRESDGENELWDDDGHKARWSSADRDSSAGDLYVLTVLAIDPDYGDNGTVRYSLAAHGSQDEFWIHSTSGRVYARVAAIPAGYRELAARACDLGLPPRCSTARVAIRPVAIPSAVTQPITWTPATPAPVTVAELDPPGFLLTVLQPPADAPALYYDIVGGDPAREFFVGRENGNILLARRLLWERQKLYRLNVSVSDGVRTAYVTIDVNVINDVNEDGVHFTRDMYQVEIDEDTPVGTVVARVEATAAGPVLYGVQNTARSDTEGIFTLHARTGDLLLQERPSPSEHLMTVWARDAAPRAALAFARVRVVARRVDRALWPRRVATVTLPRDAPPGTLVTTLRPEKARRCVAVGGDAGSALAVDDSCTVVVAGLLPARDELSLLIRADDAAAGPVLALRVLLIAGEGERPIFVSTGRGRVREGEAGLAAGTVRATGRSPLHYSLLGPHADHFSIHPLTGRLYSSRPLDHETRPLYSLTVRATDTEGAETETAVEVEVTDMNEHSPHFERGLFEGRIHEDAAVGQLVRDQSGTVPLVLTTVDRDTSRRARSFRISEPEYAAIFDVDDITGAVRLLRSLDYEAVTSYTFTVEVRDAEVPPQWSAAPASVTVEVDDVNDCAPVFLQKHYNVTLTLPAHDRQLVARLTARDPDPGPVPTWYRIESGDPRGHFHIDQDGVVTIARAVDLEERHVLTVSASDGDRSDTARLAVVFRPADDAGLAFSRSDYYTSAPENSTTPVTLLVLDVLGAALGDHVQFTLLDRAPFAVGETSGALRTMGVALDRESQDGYILHVEARSGSRAARARVHVAVADVNDNCPVFVGAPLSASVAVRRDDEELLQLRAEDVDAGDNGAVRYEMVRGHGEVFAVDRSSGRLKLRRPATAREYRLRLAAYDGGSPACGSNHELSLRLLPAGAPSWPVLPVLNVSVDSPPFAPLTPPLSATSPLRRYLLYGIEEQQPEDLFYLIYDDERELDASGWELGAGSVRLAARSSLRGCDAAVARVRVVAEDPASGAAAPFDVHLRLTAGRPSPRVVPRPPQTLAVSEASPPDTLLISLNVTDTDSRLFYRKGDIEFTIIDEFDGNVSSKFRPIPTDRGVDITLRDRLDREARANYRMALHMNDRHSGSHSSLALDVHVMDANDNAPAMQPCPDIMIPPPAGPAPSAGLLLAVLRAHDPDDNDTLQYSLLTPLTGIQLHPLTGELQLTGMWDGRTVEARVAVSDGAHAAVARVTLRPAASNMHSPRFDRPQYTVRNKSRGVLTFVRAEDEDDGEYGEIRYSIPSDWHAARFAIDELTGELRATADDGDGPWTVPVLATDGGGRVALTTVRVATERAVVGGFPQEEYCVTLARDRNNSLPFLTVQAEGGGNITYSIYTEDGSGELFHIDRQSGAISLRGNITTMGTRDELSIWVRAGDDSAAVRVRLADAAGPFVSRTNSAHAELSISEAAATGTVLLRLPRSAPHRYRLVGRGSDLFSISDEGVLTLAATLDRETADIIHIGIIMESSDYCETSGVRLRVRDENDNSPKFLSEKYHVTIAQNTPVDEQILLVSAADPDDGVNGEVRYSLEATDTPFAVDPLTGIIAVKGALAPANYTVAVVASDGGLHPRHDRAHVRLQVIAAGTPLRADRMQVTVAEDRPPGTLLATVPTARGSRLMVLDGDPHGHFALDALTGELRTAARLDHETWKSYSIMYAATDGISIAQNTLLVTVTDVNDNPPRCPSPQTATVREDAAVDTVLLTIKIADDDGAEHAAARVTVDGAGGLVAVQPISAWDYELRTTGPLDREALPRLEFTVHATDPRRKEWTCSMDVLILVSDVNDNAPRFMSAEYRIVVPEDAGVDSAVAAVRATDPDEGPAGRVRYSLEDTHGDVFSVDVHGVLWLRAELDREKRDRYRLRVIASDEGSPPRLARVSVVVTVADVNDNPPEFDERQYSAAVPESAAVGTELLRLSAVSRDEGRNAEVQYSVVGGDPRGLFALDAATGVLSLRRTLDREITSLHELTVMAVDRGDPPLSATAQVDIRVLDVNDNSPEFVQNLYTASVKEDTPIGDRILQVIANDSDEGMNARIAYSIEDDDGALDIDPDTGHVTIVRELDRETSDTIHARLQATDRGQPPRIATARLELYVLDVNDNPPLLPRELTAIIPEDRALDSVVLTLRPTDRDASPNAGPFTYDLRAGDPARVFRLDRDGSLRSIATLDRRSRDRYDLHIRVFDNGSPPLYADTVVRVTVVERSRHPPQTEALDVRVLTYMEQFAGGRLGRITATDRDAHDRLAFSLSPGPHTHLFTIDPHSGALSSAELEEGRYSLRAIASDGRRSHAAPVTVTVSSLSPVTLSAAVPVRLREVSPETFLRHHRSGLIAAAEAAAGAPAELLGCWAAPETGRARRQVARDLLVAVAVRGVSASELRARLTARLEALERGAGLVVEGMPRAPCGVRAGAAMRLVASRGASLLSPELSLDCPPAPPPSWSLRGGSPLVYRALPVLPRSPAPVTDELLLSMRVRTRMSTAVLASATGDYDYNILEIVDGIVQFRMELGSGPAVGRAGGRVDDGEWHTVRVERRGRAALLRVDRAVAGLRSPASARAMDARNVRVLIGVGLRGCLADVVMEGGELLLRGDSEAGPSHCEPPPTTPCDLAPCQNGGNCSVEGGRALCECGSRWGGERCQWDELPCASSPCLHGGTCLPAPAPALGRYRCECASGLAGERCERGRWCGAGACGTGESCEEGVRGAVCHAGGDCDADGCGDPLTDAVTVGGDRRADWAAVVLAWARAAGWWAWAGLVGLGAACVAAVAAAVGCAVARRRTAGAKDAPIAHNNKEELLNPRTLDAKRASKLSNLEAVRTPVPRLDTLRNYGAAGDELEAMPADYRRNLNLDTDHKTEHKPWSEQMHLHTFADNKIYNDLKSGRTISPAALERRDNRLRVGRDTEGRLIGGYHWDCSDWRGGGGVGQSEVPHSTDSCSPRTSPRMSPAIDDEDDDFHASQYLLHPDRYLPPPPVSPPPPADLVSLLTIEERRSLVGSHGSLRLCEIEESDDENHTAV